MFYPQSFSFFLRILEQTTMVSPLHQLIDFYNRDWVCLRRGTNWASKYHSG